MATELPIVDVASAFAASDIHRACVRNGFFYISNHGVSSALQVRLTDVMARFFAQPLDEKQHIRMALGGNAWRGFFPVGGELTSGQPDWKEGVYFGSELPPDPRPLHGPNLFASEEMRSVVLEYMSEMERVAHRLMSLVAQSLGME